MNNFTYNDIQSTAESFAIMYRQSHNVPSLPSEDELKKYKNILENNYSQVLELVKNYTSQFDPEGGHGIDHLLWVSSLAGYLAEKECEIKNINGEKKDNIIKESLLAGLFHDIDRHLGMGEKHMQQGSETTQNILESLNINLPNVISVVANHDKIDFKTSDEILEIVFGSCFDADHFRYGLEREDTFWRMKEKKGKTPEEVIFDYKFLPDYKNAWRTNYGKIVGPKFIEFGLAIAKHVENTFNN